MPEAERGLNATPATRTVGERLRETREALGLSLAEVASRTRVPLRHLEAIEASDFAGLPSRTYAVGFVRSYARAVGADEVALAHDAREEVARTTRTPAYQPYEVADPTRVPSRGLAIVAAGLALALLILGLLWFTTTVFRGGSDTQASAPPVVAAVPSAAPSVRAAPVGQVRLVANDEVWLRVYDGANETLFIGTMKAGDAFDVPPGANDPMINVGRPDKLTVTLNGSALPPLGTGERPIKDVKVSAAALAARASGQRAPVAVPSAAPTPTVPAAFASPRAERPQSDPSSRAETAIVRSGDGEAADARSSQPQPSASSRPE